MEGISSVVMSPELRCKRHRVSEFEVVQALEFDLTRADSSVSSESPGPRRRARHRPVLVDFSESLVSPRKQSQVATRLNRRLTLVNGRQDVEAGLSFEPPEECNSESNTASIRDEEEIEGEVAQSEVETMTEVVEVEPIQDFLFVPQRRAMSAGFASLDVINLPDVFEVRAAVMKTVPMFMRGAYRAAVKTSLEEIQHMASEVVQIRGWKLFFLLPRMLLSRPSRGGLIPRRTLEERLEQFNNGEWVSMVEESLDCALKGVAMGARKRRRKVEGDVHRRAARALQLCEMGKLTQQA